MKKSPGTSGPPVPSSGAGGERLSRFSKEGLIMSESEVSDEQCLPVIDLPLGDYLYRREIQHLMNYDNGNAWKIREIAADTLTKSFSNG
jgi:hypothetical protein